MEYRRLGKAGIKVSEISLGSWITFGSQLDLDQAKECMKYAFEQGINFFDNAEVYGNGESEIIMGKILHDFPREQVVISTKLFWGGEAVNSKGLSWKHLLEGIKRSLKRMRLDYVDLLYCHRPDPETPIEETVRAMDVIIRSGWAFYWGTSEWSARQIEQAYQIAEKYHCIPPTMEQPQYNLFCRERVEAEYSDLYRVYGMGTTIWSPLDSGILTGKYNEGIPLGSRLEQHNWLKNNLNDDKIAKVKKLKVIADILECSCAQLAIAWCLKNTHVSSVILGASDIQQLEHNLKAQNVKERITGDILMRMEEIFPRQY